MGSHGCVIAVALALSAALAVLPAAAQESEGDRVELARALFREGVAHADAGRYAEAAERFRRAYAIRTTPAISFNLAAALLRLGQVVEAAELLRSVTADPEAPPPLVEQAQAQLEAAEPRIARLTIRARGAGPEVGLYVDDAAVDGDVAVPLDPGRHVIEARRGDETVASSEVTLDDGEEEEVALDVPPEAAGEPTGTPERTDFTLTPAPEAREESGGISGWVWVGVGVVVAGLLVGGLYLAGVFDGPEAVSGNATPGVLEWD